MTAAVGVVQMPCADRATFLGGSVLKGSREGRVEKYSGGAETRKGGSSRCQKGDRRSQSLNAAMRGFLIEGKN